jgi:hypothetical protein
MHSNKYERKYFYFIADKGKFLINYISFVNQKSNLGVDAHNVNVSEN